VFNTFSNRWNFTDMTYALPFLLDFMRFLQIHFYYKDKHLLHSLLPPVRKQHYSPRNRRHSLQLPIRTSALNKNNFSTRMLYLTLLVKFNNVTLNNRTKPISVVFPSFFSLLGSNVLVCCS